jgi:hyperosmotically inducible periplasmic protein
MKQRFLLSIFIAAAIGFSSAPLRAQQSPTPNAGEPSADQSKNNLSDRELTKRIRKSLVDDKSLSTYAHNVKVIAQNGQVTLRGPVRSDDEKKSVEEKAAEIAGAGNVNSEVTIKAARAKNQ